MLSDSISSEKSKPLLALDGKEDKNSFGFNLSQDRERTVKQAFPNQSVYITPKKELSQKNLMCIRCFKSSLPSSRRSIILAQTGSFLFKEHYTSISSVMKHHDRVFLWSDMQCKSSLLFLMIFWRKKGQEDFILLGTPDTRRVYRTEGLREWKVR